MKKRTNVLVTVIVAFAVFMLGSCAEDAGSGSVRFQNASGGTVTNLQIGGNPVGTLAPGGYSDYFDFAVGRITASWSYPSGSTSYSFDLGEGMWRIVWNGTTPTLVSE